MTEFTIHTEETTPQASKELVQAIKGKYGFLPNLNAVQSESPAMLESYVALNQIFLKTNLSETERQIILMTNNRLNGCDYCVAAHTTVSQMAKVPADVIEALRGGTEIADSKLEALRQFAIRMNETRGWVEQSDLDAFFAAGYDKASVLDVIIGTSLKVLSNYTNHITKTPLDAAFQANAWSAVENKAA
jgi:uncharacterized peroxidase-related enzyme